MRVLAHGAVPVLQALSEGLSAALSLSQMGSSLTGGSVQSHTGHRPVMPYAGMELRSVGALISVVHCEAGGLAMVKVAKTSLRAAVVTAALGILVVGIFLA